MTTTKTTTQDLAALAAKCLHDVSWAERADDSAWVTWGDEVADYLAETGEFPQGFDPSSALTLRHLPRA
jgi:hypothetical protein